jgi:hypothetical protein
MESIHAGTSVITDEAMKNENLKESKAAEDVKYFDPVEHKVDPAQKVRGRRERKQCATHLQSLEKHCAIAAQWMRDHAARSLRDRCAITVLSLCY